MPKPCHHRSLRLPLIASMLALLISSLVVGWGPSRQQPKQPAPPRGSAKERVRARLKAQSEEQPTSRPAKEQTEEAPPASQPTTSAAAEKGPQPQVEVYIASVAALREAAGLSKTAKIYDALAGMVPSPVNETDEGFDVAAGVNIIEQIAAWPDTSLVLTVYTQDREGRPRWAIRIDWSLSELRERVQQVLDSDAARTILKDIKLTENTDGTFKLELPEIVLGVLSADGAGSLIASSADVKPPAAVFGQEATETKPPDAAEGPRKTKKRMLIYSRLNLEAGEEESDSPFAMFSGVRDIRYGLLLNDDGLWNEKLIVQWNPLVGAAMKMAFRKTTKPFDCPRDAYATAVFDFSMGEGLADAVTSLPPGTIGARAGGGTAFSLVPGNGFFPFPDVFFQFHVSKKDKVIESIRAAIADDAKTRKEQDKPPAWHEEKIGDQPVFWFDPTVDRAAGIMPATYRTVLFFDQPAEGEESGRANLVVAYRTTWADDAVKQWKNLTKSKKSRFTLPDASKAHWQARINWRSIYSLAQPYLCLLSSLAEDTTLPPTPDEMTEVLADSALNVQIEYTGLQVRHVGPIPLGAVYVPVTVAEALGSSSGAWTEAAREQVACRHLRVLYYHAKFFRKDYGRWPATVGELDGYVDFASHPELLNLRRQDRSFAERFASSFTSSERKVPTEEGDIDDSLYEIEWTPGNWKLKFRDGEFRDYATIYIDTEGEIHRVPKSAASQPAELAQARSGGQSE